MYLDIAKQQFSKLLELKNIQCECYPCTMEDIDILKKFLKLPLPKAYEELLLWMGGGCNFLDAPGGHYSYEEGKGLREFALEIMEMNDSSETLPEDAIVFWLFDEDSSFAFIRASEGDNPPVHYFGYSSDDVDPTQVPRAVPPSRIFWNWASNLDELYAREIDAYIRMRNFSGVEASNG